MGAGLGAVTGGLTGAAAASESAFHLASEEGLLTSVSRGDNHTVHLPAELPGGQGSIENTSRTTHRQSLKR
jgi:hypothetical protein